MTGTLFDDRRQKALELHARGYGYARIGRELGVPTTSVRRLVKPGYADHLRRLSLEAKRRRTGICERCGAVTRYDGHNGRVTSRLCAPCGHTQSGEKRLGNGPNQVKILAYLADGEHRFMEIARGCGIDKDTLRNALHRMLRYGLIERPRRGVYRVVSS